MSLRLVSTRGGEEADLTTALLSGLAPDGGLYVPEVWPTSPPVVNGSGDGFLEVAAESVGLFTSGILSPDALKAILSEAFGRFDHPEVAPVVPLGADRYLLELYRGPTLAFKDFALQVLSRLVDEVLHRQGGSAMILGATSGDTGSAAMEAFRDRERVDVVVLFPEGRTTEVQRRQMTTITSPNVHAVAVDGTFDDCQDLVKGAFSDPGFRADLALTTANSINFGRLITQIAYYFWAATQVGTPLSFSVPSGNFGNVYSGYAATRMGLDVDRLVVGSNANNVLHGFFSDGRLELGTVVPTLSPSMDIQIPSNLERLLFDLLGRSPSRLVEAMVSMRQRGVLEFSETGADRLFVSRWCDDAATLSTMREVYENRGILVDPHTAVGIAAARDSQVEGPIVCLATAHPAKFPEAVRQAIGVAPQAPPAVEVLRGLPERVIRLPRDPKALRYLLLDKSRFV